MVAWLSGCDVGLWLADFPWSSLTTSNFVGKVSAIGQTNQANSAFHPFGVGNRVAIHVITWITGMETTKRQTRAACDWLVAGQSPVAASLTYGLQAVSPLCDTTAPLQPQLPLVVTCKCHVFTFSASEMTYIVSSGALNSTHSLTRLYLLLPFMHVILCLNTDQGCVWLIGRRSKSRGRELSLRSIGCKPACDTTAPLQPQLPLVVTCKCHAFTFCHLSCMSSCVWTTADRRDAPYSQIVHYPFRSSDCWGALSYFPIGRVSCTGNRHPIPGDRALAASYQ